MLGVFTPLVDSLDDYVLVKIVPDLNQPLFQVVNAMNVCLVDAFLCPNLVVNWIIRK